MKARVRGRHVVLALLVGGGLVGWALVSAPRRQLDRLREELAARIDEARQAAPIARVPDEPRVEGEVHAALDAALAAIGTRAESSWHEAKVPIDVVHALAPVVNGLREALRCDRTATSFDAHAARPAWKKDHYFASSTRSYPRIDWAALALIATADHEWKTDPRAAPRTLVALWKIRHLLATRGGLVELRRSLTARAWHWRALVAAAIERSDAADLPRFDEDLKRLEASAPSFTQALERERLVIGAALLRGDLRGLARPKEVGLRDQLLATTARHDLEVFERVDSLYRRAIVAVSRREPWHARVAVNLISEEHFEEWGETRWDLSCTGDHNGVGHDDTEALGYNFQEYLEDRALLRLARFLVAARRFYANTGRWPSSHVEGLGRALSLDELDPFGGLPFSVHTGLAGELVAETSPYSTEVSFGSTAPHRLSLSLRAPR